MAERERHLEAQQHPQERRSMKRRKAKKNISIAIFSYSDAFFFNSLFMLRFLQYLLLLQLPLFPGVCVVCACFGGGVP
ncbi:hypothetical protein STCU_11486 [Strigomonas culicis]|uniref:Uncharacterized protein n=1 Tax=Strigomonas culicis TaxID=28005 RepID=S9TIL3_9TRYP|nr:hypothetical protein STCU_11486 [Strigomonas culicis]|eukprot:EPY16193.1 hypothetical protein STCU_11486 [Strigomonas culicis]